MNNRILFFVGGLLLAGHAFAQIGVEDKRNAFNNRRFYARTTRMHDNAILLHLAQLPMSVRGTYERRINSRFMTGINLGIRVAGREAGSIKSEVYGKYFVNKRAPQGLYLFGETGFAVVKNHDFSYKVDINKGESGQFNNPENFITVLESSNFTSFCGGVGFGFQNAFGTGRRTVVDFGMSYRYYSIPERISNRSFERNGLVYRYISNNNSVMSSIFPFHFRFGLGYMF